MLMSNLDQTSAGTEIPVFSPLVLLQLLGMMKTV